MPQNKDRNKVIELLEKPVGKKNRNRRESQVNNYSCNCNTFSLNKYFLSIHNIIGTILNAWDISMKKTWFCPCGSHILVRVISYQC